MPESCCAIGCTNRRKQEEENGLSFYKIPRATTALRKEKRRLWMSAIKRKHWGEAATRHARLCSAHFISGKTSDDPQDPDFVPTVFVFKTANPKLDNQKQQRFARFNRRRESSGLPPPQQDPPDNVERVIAEDLVQMHFMEEAVNCADPDDYGDGRQPCRCEELELEAANLRRELNECRCNELREENAALETEVTNLRQELNEAKVENAKLQENNFGYQSIKKDKTKLRFYTGLQSTQLFMWLLLLCQRAMMWKKVKHTACSWENQMLMVLMKMRLGLKDKDTAYRFGIHRTTISRIMRTWIPKMAVVLKETISWPSRLSVRQHLPRCFKKHFKQTVAIIDCTEIFIDRPLNLTARAETYSHYKTHNTIKYLICITPSGAVSFVSPGWGGRVSDKELTLECGIMDKLDHGDVVLADRGFNVKEDMAIKGCRLLVPAYTKGKIQLSKEDVDKSRRLSRIRIHVERVIGRLKSFNVLQTNIPITQVDMHTHATSGFRGWPELHLQMLALTQ
ncbi:uncharacterized protein [Asterias amurensis]|uniref:uncharacterized protein n=1 Tax=Asterias amurensis TaxID=7602 RepID=UPI003AB75D28